MSSSLLSAVLSRLPSSVNLVSLFGHRLVIRMNESMKTATRGHMLLGLEKQLRREVHSQMEVFLEPRGDINKLRIKTRGVVII
jgi:hypothetical protein